MNNWNGFEWLGRVLVIVLSALVLVYVVVAVVMFSVFVISPDSYWCSKTNENEAYQCVEWGQDG